MQVEGHHGAQTGPSRPLRRVLIIGGTSDLSRRHLLPALARLLAGDELPDGFGVTLTGLEPMSTDTCREFIAGELDQHASGLPSDARRGLAERISYLEADVREPAALGPLTGAEPSLIYVATPPDAVSAALDAVGAAGLHRSARIVLDKPFGLSRSSARALNANVLELFEESAVYRIDHFLYHHSVQQLLRRRAESDPLALADALPLAEVEIRWDETRPAPPGTVGVMADMIQSHLLQLAAVITMDAPAAVTRANLSSNRLEALRRLTADGTSEDSDTRAALAVRSATPRWRETPLVLRAAKGAAESRRYVEFRLAPQGFVRLEVLACKLVVGTAGAAEPAELAFPSDPESASTRLLRAALSGDDTFTLGPDEPEEAWRIVEGSNG